MIEEQKMLQVDQEELLKNVKLLFDEGYRLMQISCTKLETFQVDYTFDKNLVFQGLRLILPAEKPEMKSITGIYWCAFTYENEIHDLFGVQVKDMNIDFGGKYYRTEMKSAFTTISDQNVQKVRI